MELSQILRTMKRAAATLLAAGLVLMGVTAASADDLPALTKGISVSFQNEYGDQPSGFASTSYYARYIAFHTSATNLLLPTGSADPDFISDVFLRAIIPGEGGVPVETIEKLTQNADRGSEYPYVVGDQNADWDGRYILFQSYATNLISGDSNGKRDVFLYDRQAPPSNKITLVSAGVDGAPANNHSGSGPNSKFPPVKLVHPVHSAGVAYVQYIEEDPGQPGVFTPHPYVLFESLAGNLVAGLDVPNNRQHIYMRDVQAGTTSLVSQRADGLAPANGDSLAPAVTPDGRFVVFASNATNLVPGVSSALYTQIYLLDRDLDKDGVYDEFSESGATKMYLVSRQGGRLDGAPGNGDSGSPSVVYMPDREAVRVAFHSYGDNLMTPEIGIDTNLVMDVYVYELYGAIEDNNVGMYRVSVSSMADEANGHSVTPVLSPNGKVVAFTSYADNLDIMDNNFNCEWAFGDQVGTTWNCPDVFVHEIEYLDAPYNPTWRVSVTSAGFESEKNSGLPSLSGSGRFVTFLSMGDLLATGQLIGDSGMQVFMRDQGTLPGNPNIQPSAGDFYGWVNQPIYVEFTVRFLDDLEIGDIALAAPVGIERPDLFTIEYDDCSNRLFSGEEGANQCKLVVKYVPPDRKEKRARIIIWLPEDERGALYLGLRGTTIVRYLPMIAPLP